MVYFVRSLKFLKSLLILEPLSLWDRNKYLVAKSKE